LFAVILVLAATVPPGVARAGETATAAAPLADDEILVVDEKDLGRMWRNVAKGPPQLSPNTRKPIEVACVSVGYVIESDGRVRTANVLRSDPAGVLDAEGLRAARSMRFRLGPDNDARLPVYSVVAWSYGRGAARTVADAIAPCMVDIQVPKAAASP
jgi:TonB family protein